MCFGCSLPPYRIGIPLLELLSFSLQLETSTNSTGHGQFRDHRAVVGRSYVTSAVLFGTLTTPPVTSVTKTHRVSICYLALRKVFPSSHSYVGRVVVLFLFPLAHAIGKGREGLDDPH